MVQIPGEGRDHIERVPTRDKLLDDPSYHEARRGDIGLEMRGYDNKLQRAVSSA
jgi:hypothetical protein